MISHEALRRLRTTRAFVLDLDGTLVLGDPDSTNMRALPGAVELVQLLQAHDRSFVVLTNGTNKTTAQYAAEMRTAGFPVTGRHVLTPVESAVAVFRHRRHRKVMVLSTRSAATGLRRAGLDVVPAVGQPEGVDAVFVGWFRQVRFQHIEAACHAVWGGARLYSASQSLFFATAKGKTLGTSRAISAAIHDLTGRRVEVVGKPSALALAAAAEHLAPTRRSSPSSATTPSSRSRWPCTREPSP